MELLSIDHLELCVGNAFQAAHFYRTALGFTPVAHAGPETGASDRRGYVLVAGEARLALESGLPPDAATATFVRDHGDGVRDIAFTVADAVQAFEVAVSRGARPLEAPRREEDAHGVTVRASVAAFGDTRHSFIERRGYAGAFCPGFAPFTGQTGTPAAEIVGIDHLAVCLESGTMERWATYYRNVFEFQEIHRESVIAANSGMNSVALQDRSGRIKLVLLESPTPGGRSQIEDFLRYNRGPGVQHVAFLSSDIRATTRALRGHGLQFLTVPSTYYAAARERVADLTDDELASLSDLGILVDHDGFGKLWQVFTRPVQTRPTMFLEVIERQGARGFGSGNIKALYKAVEREQALRDGQVEPTPV